MAAEVEGADRGYARLLLHLPHLPHISMPPYLDRHPSPNGLSPKTKHIHNLARLDT